MAHTLVPKTRIPWRHLVLFGWMPGFLKKFAYRTILGYQIGRRVSLSFGSVIIGKSVTLGDDVEIGLMAVVQGRSITIGRHSSIGTFTYVSCETIEIGEDAKIREQVFIGGPQLPESKFTLGSRTIVLQMTYINPTKPVTIGDDTGIGGHCLIFTHGAWLNVLDGYPATYAPVTIGKSVWLPWRVFVMPGATIGDGSVIGGDSMVQGTIPPRSLAVGSPAKVIRSAPDWPRVPSAEQQRGIVAGIVSEFERYVANSGVTIASDGNWRSYARDGRTWRMLWRRDESAAPALQRDDTVLSEAALSESDRTAFRSAGVHWLDLAGRTRSVGGSPLTEELAVFIARYGMRLPRDG
jgi:acetyltransferase-like isoleucine patch superfamily enzyme